TVGYVDICLYKGYIDFGFTSADKADTAASLTVQYKSQVLPTTCTNYHKNKLTVICFTGLPTHLPSELLYCELMLGLLSYGAEPTILSDVPSSVNHLTGPTASATVISFEHISPNIIPPRAVIPSAPFDAFNIIFYYRCSFCNLCYKLDHNQKACPLLKAATPVNHCLWDSYPVWGSLIPPSTSTANNTHQSVAVNDLHQSEATNTPDEDQLEHQMQVSNTNSCTAPHNQQDPAHNKQSHPITNNMSSQFEACSNTTQEANHEPINHQLELELAQANSSSMMQHNPAQLKSEWQRTGD
ncbi:hypothetical protein DSO57_1017277, partial [Entomophthora muscae]